MAEMHKGGRGANHNMGMTEDIRVDALQRLVEKRSDDTERVGTVHHKIVNQERAFETTVRSGDYPVLKSTAREEFAKFLSEKLGADGILDMKSFECYLGQFQKEATAESARHYRRLDSKAQEIYIEAVRAAAPEYLIAFSAVSTEPGLVMPAPVREGSLSFAAMPKTLEEVYECFNSYCADAEVAKILAGKSPKVQFSAFKEARRLSGIVETPETTQAINEFAAAFDLA